MGGDPTRVCLPCNFFLERHGVLPPATWDAARCEAEDNCESKVRARVPVALTIIGWKLTLN